GSEYTESLNICVGLNKGSTNETIYDYILRQNYPNPFNPTTQISFSLKENSFVSLKVYDILGREVAVLVNEVLTAGNHQVQFNGSSLKSGIYFYEIRTDKFRDMRKLVLLK
ncbi:MAG: T9SS type A sorting domain-containing protein, partial [Ignavibacteriaceae bacterium]|nr:T9SS type A sorting domain-containing protein [Ignavibacteriaceae bacterium]